MFQFRNHFKKYSMVQKILFRKTKFIDISKIWPNIIFKICQIFFANYINVL